MLSALWLTGLLLACLLGLLLVALQLPGTWVILAAAAGYGWHGDFTRLTLAWLGVIGALAVAGELFELLSSMLLARRAGASRRAACCGLIGGMLGMFLLSLPVPLIGTIVGGVLGCFLGAVMGELTLHDDAGRAARVGFAAAVGRVAGLVAKLAVAFAMTGLTIYAALR